MTNDRILAADIMVCINDEVEKHLQSEHPVTFGEIFHALRVCMAVTLDGLAPERRAEYVQHNMIALAQLMGIPLIPMEVDMPSKSEMN